MTKMNKKFPLSLEKSPFFYLLPVALFMAIMVAYPVIRLFYLSLTQNILTRPDLGVSFIGLDNYLTLFSSVDFWKTLTRTVLWTGYSVAGKAVIGFIIALLLSKVTRFKRLYFLLLLIPWVTPMVVGSISWRWVYDGQFGMLNWVLTRVHILSENYVWLGNEISAFLATGITDMWLGIPLMTMLMLAGLQSVPVELLESASLDGATFFQRLRLVILPLMKPVILVATTLSAIWTFNSFGVIWPLTKGGPVDATQTLVVKAYKESFGAFDLGMGATIAVVIFLILLSFTTVYYKAVMRQEEI
ncbi:carbohydrate ABC transporter permease [Paenactinomyces guangxiensis]|uniref:Sugar ABC transporter permease n=1 Tax=Paenactinomyces guangxiensis TaxID=1490290 RepID=A0A7W1WR10_9BACL|nr:sugar ABC transporter permease [Paenactinomyces guangxiensis]MBA4494353.1 sugar ABC transporter permease [Paenactinomyces guangxiensis]MBH8591592.1 sugar ABC transporter permease [Paenactinomyces guangxiensis]